MKHFLADHSCKAYLKPGEVIFSFNPVLVSTVLGSCVAITMYAPTRRIGAICHAMLPTNRSQIDNHHYVDSAVRALHRKMLSFDLADDLVIKLFGGAQVLAKGQTTGGRPSVGEQNITQAKNILKQLGLGITSEDVGGYAGRKLLFSIKTGDVYLRKLKLSSSACACRKGASS